MTTLSERLTALKNQIDRAPERPGCYLFRDDKGDVLYVGKAVNLRNRLRSYFHASALRQVKVRRLMERVTHVEWIVVGSELEALILEMNLIKRYRPRYNIQFRDDKRYPYIKIHWQDPFPKVTVTRRVEKDGARYYGPYPSAWAVHETLDVLRRIFPYLTCNRTITGKDPRACLYYDIGLCAGPCIGAISQRDYRRMMEDLAQVLEGRIEPVVERLEREMREAAERLDFELAARRRDQIRALRQLATRQRVVSEEYLDSDVLALARANDEAVVQVFFIRGGKLLGRETFVLENTQDVPDAEVLAAFLKRFYHDHPTPPPQILLPREVEEARIIERWLRDTRQMKVSLKVPRDEKHRALLELAAQNAAEALKVLVDTHARERHRHTEAVAELQELLDLKEPPVRIEGYDISTLYGTAMVGSMVVFEEGIPRKSLYRRFHIRSLEHTDDYAALAEVLTRRFKRWQAAQEPEARLGQRFDRAFALLPDLILIDGGLGQRNRAEEVLRSFGLADRIPVVALAKSEEVLYLPGQPKPLRLPPDSPALHLLQRVRNEAHRFALASHRQRRQKQTLTSFLEGIPGVGPKRRRALMDHFGTWDALRAASVEELARVPGISPKLAQRIWQALHGEGEKDMGTP